MRFRSLLPLDFSASYCIDEFIDSFSSATLKHITHFRLSAISPKNQATENNPWWCVIYNLISRGNPTRASQWLTHQLLNEHNVSYAIDPYNAHYQYKITEITEETANRITHSLPTIAGFQKAICWLLATGNIDTTEKITLCIPQEQFSLAQLAIDDLNEWFSAFLILGGENIELLHAHYELLLPESTQQPYAIIKASSCVYQIDWKPVTESKNPTLHLLTGKKIQYPSFGKFADNGRLLLNEENSIEKQLAAEYILQSVFRKHSFRAGQLKIINRAIQNLDVVGLLPTGGGKSLTYQFTSLLQPTITIVIDPINSLMRDQYDKLLENGIDSCLYINSYNTKEEQLQNMTRLAEGQVKFAFVSPERLQIAKFRDGLKSCFSNGVHIGLAVVDEAHCVSEWGHDFRHTYLRLADNLKSHCKPAIGDTLTIMALTATASFDVLTDIRRELQMDREAEQTLPVDQIERKELTYHIEKIVPVVSYNWKGMADWERQKKLARTKYPVLKNILKQRLPTMLGLESYQQLFDPNEGGYYPSAGLIFCNTKSDARGDGVAALATGMVNQAGSTLIHRAIEIEGLNKENYLRIVTYMGGDNDQLSKNTFVNKLSEKSFDNQGSYLLNEANLMIATKAFGMGIDKPNVRFTIHYGLPNSVESFYQEAGRAGRDRNPAICMILHHESDRLTNEEFLKNSFKGQEKEEWILREFLEEVQYENEFFIKTLKDEVSSIFPDVKTISLFADRYLYINGLHKKVDFGRIDLLNQLTISKKNIKNLLFVDQAEGFSHSDFCDEVLGVTIKLLKERCPNENYVEYLTQTKTPGLETVLKQNNSSDGPFHLIVGFSNNEIPSIRKVLEEKQYLFIPEGYKDWHIERFIRSAYNFSQSPEEFLANLPYQYTRFLKTAYEENNTPANYSELGKAFENKLLHDLSLQNHLLDSFWRIRDIADTQRAIYRLSLLGVIYDYTINFSEKTVTLRFVREEEKQYRKNFEEYLKRYQGDGSVAVWLGEADNRNEETLLRRCLFTLTDFVYGSIRKKRESAIQYMHKQCELFLEKGQQAFRQNILYYFTSKYAANEYLPDDSKNSDTLETVGKYIHWMETPPEELGIGAQVDNYNHLKGATERVLSSDPDNKTALLLRSFANILLETHNKEIDLKSFRSPDFNQAIEDYITNFYAFSLNSPYDQWNEKVVQFNNQLKSINNQLEPLVNDLSERVIAQHWNTWLGDFMRDFADVN